MASLLCLISLAFSLTPSPYVTVRDASELGKWVDFKVCVEGIITSEVSQHLVASPTSYPQVNYFIMDGQRMIVYSKTPIKLGKTKVYGSVLPIRGYAKGPDPREEYIEYHILADKWDYLN
ncbi:MAG: hypothetical protein V1843_02730 [bacterium]